MPGLDDHEPGVFGGLPALAVLDPRDSASEGPEWERHLRGPIRTWLNPIDDEVQVLAGVIVERPKNLMAPQAELIEGYVDGRFELAAIRLLSFTP